MGRLHQARKATNGLLGALRTAVVARLVLWGLLIVLLLAGVIALKVSVGEEAGPDRFLDLSAVLLLGETPHPENLPDLQLQR